MPEADSRLVKASRCLQAGDPAACVAICNELVALQPGHLAARHLRGVAAAKLGDLELAISDFSRVWAAQPANLQAALGLGAVLRQTDRLDEALAPLTAAKTQPDLEIAARYELGRVLTRLRRSDEAMQEYRAVLKLDPAHADAAANLAFLLERANRLEEAELHADQVLSKRPTNFMAALTKAVLERRRGAVDAATHRLEALARGDITALNRSIVQNQLGQCHEQSQSWELAFESYRVSNLLLQQGHPLGKPEHAGSYGLNTVNAIHRWLNANPPLTWSANHSPTTDEPVFLVGFPRSGTTLLDQALSAHPDIEVLEEHEFLRTIRRQWVEGDGLARLTSMGQHEIDAARKVYLDALALERAKPGCRIVVDKLPLNLVYLFLIHRLFPHARIILMVRDPRDACLSCYFQAFDLQGAMPYFLDLGNTVQYYLQVMALAIDTLGVISNPCIRMNYERMLAGFEPAMRELVEFLGAGWNPEVLNYREKSLQRMISTPSYQQVVQPLYTRSVGRWQHFRKQTETELQALGPWVRYFGYSKD